MESLNFSIAQAFGRPATAPYLSPTILRAALFCSIVFACALVANAAPAHVVLITIDGGGAYELDNPNLSLPNIRSLISHGAWADHGSETVFPSVTHPSHTTIITGVLPIRHGDLSNALLDREHDRVIPPNSQLHSESVKAKTIFDTAKEKHLTTASIFWPESIEDPSIDFNLMLRTTGTKHAVIENNWTKELQADGVPISFYNEILAGKASPELFDSLNTMALCDVIAKHRPNLMAIHLVATDEVEHKYGPASALAEAAFDQADTLIGRIVDATKKAGIYDTTTFIITADHGFAAVHYEMNLRAFFAQAGLVDKIKIYHPGWAPFIRLLPSFQSAVDGPKLQAALHRLSENVHILRVYNSSEYPSLGLPRYEDSNRIPGQYLIIPDIDTFLMDTPDDSTELRKRDHPAYTHGYLPQYPAMYPLLVLAGSGIRKGVLLGHVHQVDIAPTITKLLDLPPLQFDGHVLLNALEN